MVRGADFGNHCGIVFHPIPSGTVFWLLSLVSKLIIHCYLFSRKPQRQKKASELDAEVGIGAAAGASAAAPGPAKKVEKPEVSYTL